MYFVSGASGKTGGALVRALRRAGREVRTLTRNPERAGPLAAAGVEVVVGDGADPAVLARALRGVEKAVVIYPNGRHQGELERALVDAAVAAGTRHLVKLSSMEALPDTTNPVHRIHYESEQYIRASGLDFTMIRPNFFMQNLLGNAATIRGAGKFFLPLGAGAAAMTDVRDVAEVIAHVLERPGHTGQVYAITGPAVLDFTQVAAQFSAVLGRPIEYVDQDPEAYKAYLGQFLRDPWHLDAVCAIFREIREGYVAPATDTFQKLMGRPPTDLASFVRDHIAAFAAPTAAGV